MNGIKNKSFEIGISILLMNVMCAKISNKIITNIKLRKSLNIILKLGGSNDKIILGFMLATGFLSMWISNTATTVMMLPIALSVINQVKDHPDTLKNENKIFGKALMLAVA